MVYRVDWNLKLRVVLLSFLGGVLPSQSFYFVVCIMRAVKFIVMFVALICVVFVWHRYDTDRLCARYDHIKYCFIDNVIYTGWLKMQTGGTIWVYDIVDTISWIRFRYRLYDAELSHVQIQEQVHHVYSDAYSSVSLYVAEGWWFMTTLHYTGSLDNEWLQHFLLQQQGSAVTDCILTGSIHTTQLYPRFAQPEYKVWMRDTVIGDQALLSCPFVVSPVRMPIFIIHTRNPAKVFVAMLPTDIAGIVDMDRLNSLIR